MIKAVCFDMDGVVTDTEKLHYISWRDAFEFEKVFLSKEVYKNNLQSISHSKGIRRIIKDASDKQITRMSKNKRASYDLLITNNIDVFEDTLTLIKGLKDKEIKLAVVSSSSYAKLIIDKVGLNDYFEFVIAGTKGMDIRNKPHPDIYLEAIKRLELNPEEVLVVEDSINGMNAGLSAGCSVLGVNRFGFDIDDQERLMICDEINSLEVIRMYIGD